MLWLNTKLGKDNTPNANAVSAVLGPSAVRGPKHALMQLLCSAKLGTSNLGRTSHINVLDARLICDILAAF